MTSRHISQGRALQITPCCVIRATYIFDPVRSILRLTCRMASTSAWMFVHSLFLYVSTSLCFLCLLTPTDRTRPPLTITAARLYSRNPLSRSLIVLKQTLKCFGNFTVFSSKTLHARLFSSAGLYDGGTGLFLSLSSFRSIAIVDLPRVPVARPTITLEDESR